jgi:hypothetical protein
MVGGCGADSALLRRPGIKPRKFTLLDNEQQLQELAFSIMINKAGNRDRNSSPRDDLDAIPMMLAGFTGRSDKTEGGKNSRRPSCGCPPCFFGRRVRLLFRTDRRNLALRLKAAAPDYQCSRQTHL